MSQMKSRLVLNDQHFFVITVQAVMTKLTMEPLTQVGTQPKEYSKKRSCAAVSQPHD